MKTLYQCLDSRKESNLFVGDGLPRQLGYDTGTENIIKRMEAADSKYKRFSEKIKRFPDTEFEKLLLLIESKLDVRGFKEDFSQAICEIITEKPEVVDVASSWFSKFDNVFSLNFDPLMIGIYNRLVEYGFVASAIFHDETLTPGQKECKLQLFNLTANFCKVRVAEGYHPVIKHNLLISDALVRHAVGKRRPRRRDTSDTIIKKPFFDGFENKVWEINPSTRESQNFTHLHGSFHIVVMILSGEIRKVNQVNAKTLRRFQRLLHKKGERQLFVLCATYQEKLKEINDNDYLREGLRRLKAARGVLIVYGVNIYKETDRHLWEAICKNKKLKEIYIATNDPDAKLPDWLTPLLEGKKVEFFDRNLNLLPQKE